ncbi:MAG: hypothetical protein NTZ64_16585 [Polaromonas sp.]|nr:hypothetical protein [Polaromonas sp.]
MLNLSLTHLQRPADKAVAEPWLLALNLRYAEFPNAHEITRDELAQAMQWLAELAP